MSLKLATARNRMAKRTSPVEAANVDQPQVADLVVSYLEQLGVEYVFGIPGGAIEPIYNALARSSRRGGPRPVVARHESGAAFMADGYARETGRLGVCIATSGPGATNLITGVACAHANNIPVLAITGLPALPSFGRGALQESCSMGVNATAMFGHCTHYNALVSHAEQIERKLANAVMKAFQNPGGAAHLAIPLDIQRTPTAYHAPAYGLAGLIEQRASLIDADAVRALRDDVRRAARIVVLIGNGCGEAVDAIMATVGLTGAEFVTTPDAKGFVNPRHAAYRGVFGFGGHATADALLNSAPDLVLAIGTGFAELISGNRCDAVLRERLVHIDCSEENLLRSPMAIRHVRGRIRSVCERLNDLLREDGIEARDEPILLEGAAERVAFHVPEAMLSDATPIKPQRLIAELSGRCPPDTRFIADIGNSMVWATHYLQPKNRRAWRPGTAVPNERRSTLASWLRIIMEFCPMGWAIGAAVGIARGNAKHPVVCITGDGAYLMSGQEITVAAMEGLPVVFVILNDSSYGMVRHGQRLAGAEQIATELPRIDYCKLAGALGVPAHVIESPQDLEGLDIEAILRRSGPTVLDVRIDAEEVPPISVRMKALGTLQ